MGPGFESPKADHVYKARALLYNVRGPLVKWLRQWPLTPLTSVRIRYGSPALLRRAKKALDKGEKRGIIKKLTESNGSEDDKSK